MRNNHRWDRKKKVHLINLSVIGGTGYERILSKNIARVV